MHTTREQFLNILKTKEKDLPINIEDKVKYILPALTFYIKWYCSFSLQLNNQLFSSIDLNEITATERSYPLVLQAYNSLKLRIKEFE